MPTYDYRCPKCGLAFEVLKPFSRADEPAPCPNDGTPAERQFSLNANFVLRGGAETAEPPPLPSMDDMGHGHSHGPGGHTH